MLLFLAYMSIFLRVIEKILSRKKTINNNKISIKKSHEWN